MCIVSIFKLAFFFSLWIFFNLDTQPSTLLRAQDLRTSLECKYAFQFISSLDHSLIIFLAASDN